MTNQQFVENLRAIHYQISDLERMSTTERLALYERFGEPAEKMTEVQIFGVLIKEVVRDMAEKECKHD